MVNNQFHNTNCEIFIMDKLAMSLEIITIGINVSFTHVFPVHQKHFGEPSPPLPKT